MLQLVLKLGNAPVCFISPQHYFSFKTALFLLQGLILQQLEKRISSLGVVWNSRSVWRLLNRKPGQRSSEFMPALGSSPAQASMLVGDFTAAFELVRIGQGSGFTLIRDEVTTKGQTKFYIAARYLGRPIINDAVKAVMR